VKLSEAIKPISELKAHASEIIRDISRNRKTVVITHNGAAKVVVQDVESYEQTQESLALLKLLAQSSKSLKKGRTKPAARALADIAKRTRKLP